MADLARRRLLALALLAGAVGPAGCGHPPAPLRIGANLWVGYLGLRLAEIRRGFDPSVARVVDFPSTSAVIQAFREGLLDGAALTLDECLMLAEGHLPIKVVLVFNLSHGADAIVARAGVSGVSALAGRRVGVETGALGAYLLARALETGGLSPHDIALTTLALDQHVPAFLAGEVDAVVTFDPVRSQLLARGGHEIFSSRDMPGEILDVLVFREDAVLARSPAIQQVVDAYFAALPDVFDAGKVVKALGARAVLDEAALSAALQGLSLPDRAGNLALFGQGEQGLSSAMQRLSAFMSRHGLLRRPVSAPQVLLSNHFLRGRAR